MSRLELFKSLLAPTTENPLGLEVKKARGSYIYDVYGKRYLDFVAGVSAVSVGHCNSKIRRAVRRQMRKHNHVMVYGEFIQEVVLNYAKKLTGALEPELSNIYLVNSGTEAIEGAIKLAKVVTGKTQIIAAKQAYHGNTYGSLSLMDYKERINPFRPLLPGVSHIEFNNEEELDRITSDTAAVILETIQGGAGFIEPKNGYLKKVKARCEAEGALLILDEIQPGFGRTGALFAYRHYEVTPDILVIGKGMAGGLPVGAFISSKENMSLLGSKPRLGHITTFGGNPVIAAAALATLEEIISKEYQHKALEHEILIRKCLKHPLIEEIRGKGLMLALILKNSGIANHLVTEGLKEGIILFWLLYEKRAVRITPPLSISEKELKKGCGIILSVLDRYTC